MVSLSICSRSVALEKQWRVKGFLAMGHNPQPIYGAHRKVAEWQKTAEHCFALLQ
jgi:hypothetical protein